MKQQSFQSKEWLDDFKAFMEVPSEPVPYPLFDTIRQVVHRDLHPSPWLVFAKLVGIHSVVGSLSLLICSQFGMGPAYGGKMFMSLTMRLGEAGCMIFCGALFVGLSFLVAGMTLTTSEVRVLKRTKFLQAFFLGVLSMGVFLCLGADVVFGLGMLWLMGAILGGILTAELSWRMRLKTALT